MVNAGSSEKVCPEEVVQTTGLIQLSIAQEEQQRNKALFITVRAAESEWLMHATQK